MTCRRSSALGGQGIQMPMPAVQAVCARVLRLLPRRGAGSSAAPANRLRPPGFGHDQRPHCLPRPQPAGWCAVEPRLAYQGLLRNNRIPWTERAEDKSDGTVWAVTCFFTRAGFRKRGIGRALARAAADHARDRGARAIEGYPIITQNVILEELHVGTAGMFADAGFSEVSRPTPRRIVMRIDF